MTGYGRSFRALAALGAASIGLGLWAGGAAAQVVADDVVCSQCVGKGDIADKAVTAKKIKSNSIFSPKIVDRSIKGVDIELGAVTTSEVADDSLTAVDLADEAGVEFDDTVATAVSLTSTRAIYESVTLTAPRAGFVIVNAAGWFNFQAGAQTARCWITTGTSLEGASLAIAENDNVISWLPWALTRVYEVSAGSLTVNLLCDLVEGSNTRLGATNLNALYVPTRY